MDAVVAGLVAEMNVRAGELHAQLTCRGCDRQLEPWDDLSLWACLACRVLLSDEDSEAMSAVEHEGDQIKGLWVAVSFGVGLDDAVHWLEQESMTSGCEKFVGRLRDAGYTGGGLTVLDVMGFGYDMKMAELFGDVDDFTPVPWRDRRGRSPRT